MAIAFGNVSYRLLDELGVVTPYAVFFTVDDSNTVADVVSAALAYGVFLDAVTSAQILEVDVKLTGVGLPGGAKSAPIAGSRNNQIGNFSFAQAGSKYRYTTNVPALRDTLIVNQEINDSAAAVTNLTGELVTPGGVLDWVSQAVHDLTDWTLSFISFRKHRKLNIQKSRETA
jgi:hypothetical protein